MDFLKRKIFGVVSLLSNFLTKSTKYQYRKEFGDDETGTLSWIVKHLYNLFLLVMPRDFWMIQIAADWWIPSLQSWIRKMEPALHTFGEMNIGG